MEENKSCKIGDFYFNPAFDFLGKGDQATVYWSFRQGKCFALKVYEPNIVPEELSILQKLKDKEGII